MSIEELVQTVQLEDIRCVERVGALRLDENIGLSDWDESAGPTGLNLQVNAVTWDRQVESWFRLEVEHPAATVRATYATVYRRDEDTPIPADVKQDFLQRVAIMACMPYLREAIQHIAAELRLGSLVIPIVRHGEIQIELGEG